MVSIGVLTVSDKGSRGEREDRSGPVIREIAEEAGWTVAEYAIVPDRRENIVEKLTAWADGGTLDVILTTGGTGLAPRDITPEATLTVIDRNVPGIAEVMRAVSMQKTPMAMLSRGIAGLRGSCLIVNLPGSPKAVLECLEAIMPAIPHGVEIIRGAVTEHTTGTP